MTKEVYIPKLGQTVEEVTIIKWLKDEGDIVKKGEEILEVETDKAIFPVEAGAKGTLHLGPYQPEDVVPVLTVVAVIGKPEDVFIEKTSENSAEEQNNEIQNSEKTKSIKEAAPPIKNVTTNDRIFISPRAQMRAEALGVDPSEATPTGYGGLRIIEKDILTLAESVSAIPADSPATAKQIPLEGIRAVIANRMQESSQTTARVTLITEVNASQLVKFKQKLKAEYEKKWGLTPGYNEILAWITTKALKAFPYMNAGLNEKTIEQWPQINMGFAVDTERGLLVPVIKNIDKKNLKDICNTFRSLVEQTKQNRIPPEDLTGGTFTLTNLGRYEIDAFTPVINLPETAILGIGRIAERPFVVDHQLTVQHTVTLSLAFDHRLVDGAPAARFLQTVKHLIETPALLAI